MSSSDGFCSTLGFNPGELGEAYRGPPSSTHSHSPSLAISISNSNHASPLPTPTNPSAPSPAKQFASVHGHVPSPAMPARSFSPTRSNSASSIATQQSSFPGVITNNPTPMIGNVPSVAATNSAPAGLPLCTPPMTPMSAATAPAPAPNPAPTTVLGKRDASVASQSEPDEGGGVPKRRRIAPTLVSRNDSPAPK